MGEEKRAAVKVLNFSTVAAEVETPTHGLWLSNLDLTAFQNYTTNFSVYRSNGDPDFFASRKLKSSLSKVLVPFYPLAGRLVRAQDGRLEINCNNEGVPFIEAEANCTIDELGDFAPGSGIGKMLVPSVPSGDPPCVLLLLQVTSFTCGGVTLGVAVHHTAVDGHAALHFIGTWADITRGVENLLPPFLDRGLLRARSPPKVLYEQPAYRPTNTQETPHAEAKPISTAMFLLSQQQLAALRMSSSVQLGTFKAVASYVWRCLCKCQGLADDKVTRLHMVVDARSRLDPPLPKNFFGNAALRLFVTARVGDVIYEPLESTANRIHDVTSRVGDEYVRSLVDFLELQEDPSKLTSSVYRLSATDIWVVSWLGLPVYETDFGWGRPVSMRRTGLPRSGMVYMIPNKRNDGSVSLIVSLQPECMLAFEKTFYHGLEHLKM